MDFDVTADLEPSQKDAFYEFKKRVSEDFKEKVIDDFRLCRFLKARDFDVNQAQQMLYKHLKCREEDKVDDILQTHQVGEVLKTYFPLTIFGFDREGCPIYLFDLGNADLKGILKSVKKSECLKHFTYFLELGEAYMQEQTKKLKKPIQSWTFILNVENYTLASATHKPTIDCMIDNMALYELNYPERLKVCFIINAPIYFNYIVSVMKKIMSSRTMQKARIFGKDNWQHELLNCIEPEVLPAFLGGTRTDPDGNPMCVKTIAHGKIVPKSFYFRSPARRLSNAQGIQKYNLKSGSKASILLEVKVPRSFIEWEFESEMGSIAFGLFYKPFHEVNEEPKQIIPIQKVDAHMQQETGALLCEESGIYIFVLDNSFSWFRAKEIFFRSIVREPQSGEDKTS